MAAAVSRAQDVCKSHPKRPRSADVEYPNDDDAAIIDTTVGKSNGTNVSLDPLYPRPAWSLAPWQAIAISVAAQAQENAIHHRSLKTHNTFLLRDLSKFHTEQKYYSRKREQEQRTASDKVGKQLFTTIKRHWDSAAKLHQQLLKVDFETTKRNIDAKKQEDMLRETESLTKSLLESMIRDRQRVPLSSSLTSASSASLPPKAWHGSRGDITPQQQGGLAATAEVDQSLVRDAAIVITGDDDATQLAGDVTSSGAALATSREGEDADDDQNLENQLHLLNTLNGARPLRVYQRSALRWMLHLYNQGLNGILADEMGLGKTVQTLALIAYFAEYKNDWGPHLIVVPTTVVLNWTAECRRWCPGFKVVTYIGTAKERAALRQGWTAEDAFHICITTYNLVVNDRNVFRRRPWGLLVLDEAHYIKNFASQKWRALFDLQAQHRLMLTGTPLQSSVMELWSLFHFLLPFATAFQSEEEFRDWYSNPVNDMVDERSKRNDDIVRRLHALLRPFMLRRLKRDVESQLPSKTEKVILCRLSRRQQAIYDEFILDVETRRRLRGGGMGLFDVLLKLRKVCDHPDLFAERPTRSPFVMSLPYGTHRGAVVAVPAAILLTRDSGVRCRLRWNRQSFDVHVDDMNMAASSLTGAAQSERSTATRSVGNERALQTWLECVVWTTWVPLLDGIMASAELYSALDNGSRLFAGVPTQGDGGGITKHASKKRPLSADQNAALVTEKSFAALLQRDRRASITGNSTITSILVGSGDRLLESLSARREQRSGIFTRQQAALRLRGAACAAMFHQVPLFRRAAMQRNSGSKSNVALRCVPLAAQVAQTFPGMVPTLAQRFHHWTTKQLIERVCVYVPAAASRGGLRLEWHGSAESNSERFTSLTSDVGLAPLLVQHLDNLRWHAPDHPFTRHCVAAAGRSLLVDARVPPPEFATARPTRFFGEEGWDLDTRQCMGFPDKRLLIHDCGKFQVLEPLLKKLRAEGHRALIFTQFTMMLDLLEKLLAFIGVAYLRIDGSTKPEARQKYVDTFNETEGITCMILSTRSGGIGLNLTGADTVIFFDSDWNPTIDLQAQDRCHRIGQTRPVTIFRLVTHHTVEEKILEKARQKKMLNNVVIKGGQFASIATAGEGGSDAEGGGAVRISADDVLQSYTTSLESFFHDKDEDADIDPINFSGDQFDASLMGAVEDAEDREALDKNLQEVEQQQREDEQDKDVMGDDIVGDVVGDIHVLPSLSSSTNGRGEQPSLVVQRAKLRILHNYRSSSTASGQDVASTAVRHMATSYELTHPHHAQRQRLHLEEYYGVITSGEGSK